MLEAAGTFLVSICTPGKGREGGEGREGRMERVGEGG